MALNDADEAVLYAFLAGALHAFPEEVEKRLEVAIGVADTTIQGAEAAAALVAFRRKEIPHLAVLFDGLRAKCLHTCDDGSPRVEECAWSREDRIRCRDAARAKCGDKGASLLKKDPFGFPAVSKGAVELKWEQTRASLEAKPMRS